MDRRPPPATFLRTSPVDGSPSEPTSAEQPPVSQEQQTRQGELARRGDPASAFDPAPAARIHQRSLQILAILLGLFWLLRGPVMFRQIPAQDEDYFAVPGYTILREGIPRIPYLPSRDRTAAFYRADEALYALPPLYFYWQAAAYAVLGPSTGAARAASAMAGSAAVVTLYLLGRAWFQSEAAAVWGAALYAFSRVLYFPCLAARPDMLCGWFGLLALVAAQTWWTTGRRGWLISSGAAIGFGLLTHPFAILYALPIGCWSLVRGPRLADRLLCGTLVTGMALLTLAAWLPLIALHPELFSIQFSNNVLNKSGPGLLARLLAPGESFRTQAPLFLEHVGPTQVVLLAIALLSALSTSPRWRLDFRSGCRSIALWLALGGIYLQVVVQGTHPTKGYWVYTLAPAYLCGGALLARVASSMTLLRGGRWLGPAAATAIAAIALLPGAGLRTVAAHLRHWNDVAYNAPRFTQMLLAATPSEGRHAVDPGYVFGFYLAGRKTVLALNFPFFFDVTPEPYDLLIAGPYSLRDDVPQALHAVRQRSFGDRNDLFACYAELYVAPPERRPQAGENRP